MAVNAFIQLGWCTHCRNKQRGEFTVGVSNEESNRNVALSFEPSCVRREGLNVNRAWGEERRGPQVPVHRGLEVGWSRPIWVRQIEAMVNYAKEHPDHLLRFPFRSGINALPKGRHHWGEPCNMRQNTIERALGTKHCAWLQEQLSSRGIALELIDYLVLSIRGLLTVRKVNRYELHYWGNSATATRLQDFPRLCAVAQHTGQANTGHRWSLLNAKNPVGEDRRRNRRTTTGFQLASSV